MRNITLPVALIFAILLTLLGYIYRPVEKPISPTPDLDRAIGRMLMVGFRGTALADSNHIVRDITTYDLGGVILFDYDVPTKQKHRNITGPQQLRVLIQSLQNLSADTLLIAVDQEGGRVGRLKSSYGFKPTVSAAYLGAVNDLDTTRAYADEAARQLNRLGVNVNFAPVVDLNVNPDNPVIGALDRSFSSDPWVVTKHAGIVIDEHLEEGIIPVPKHFPGHGSAWNDSHVGMADVTTTWQPIELLPYQRLIEERKLPMVMTAHIFNAALDSLHPATLSQPVISGLLRDSLGFEGVVVSDDMQMKAIRSFYGLKESIRLALTAGVDILLFANNSIYDAQIVPKAHRIIKELLDEGAITREQIMRSERRILKMKKRYLAP